MMDMLPPAFVTLVAVFGMVLGSFGNVLIFRIPKGRTIAGRSACPHCKRVLAWYELIPVLSYAALLGRCRTCHKRISPQYPLIEIASGSIAILALFLAPTLPSAFFLGIALWLLLLLAVIDGRTGTVPDALSIPFIFSAILWAILGQDLTMETAIALLGAMSIGVAFFGVQWLVSKGQWVGSGDIFLAAGIGALVSTPLQMIVALGLSYIIGAVIASGFLVARQKTLASNLAFGPFLACGGFLTLVLGEEIQRMIGLM